MTHSLTLGSLLLTGSLPDAEHGFVFSVLADGATFGVAQSVQEVVRSLLADGDLVRTTRYGNREVSFKVLIEGPSLGAVANGEAALRREVGRPNVLTWQAPDLFSVPTVFEVVASEMVQSFDDLDEMNRRRIFTVTLACAPFARSAAPVTVSAITPPPSSTPVTASINNADSISGWSGAVTNRDENGSLVVAPATVTDVGDGINVSGSGLSLSFNWDLGTTTSIAATPYVLVELAGPAPSVFRFTTVNGVHDMPVSAAYTTPSGAVRFFFDVGSRSTAVKSVTLLFESPDPSAARAWSVTVYDISATDTPPTVNSRQTSRVIEGRGTERTPTSINVSPGSGGTSLDWAIVHTAPETMTGHSPALRQYRVSGNTRIADVNFMSGEAEPVASTPIVAQVPLAAMPEGEYALVALMRSSVVGSFGISWEARTLLPGIGYLGGTVGTSTAKFTAANTWTLVPLDVVTLPPVRSNGAFVQLNLSRVSTGETIQVDEWWSLRLGDGCATTILYDNAAHLWLDSPDVNTSVPRVWVGGNGDRSDAHHPSFNLYAQDAHVLHPGGTSIFVATSGLSHPNVSATFYPRWHSNAAE